MSASTAQVLEMALEQGFDAAGVAPLRPPRAAERFAAWLAAGHHAGMEWLERQAPRILDPRRVRPTGKSLLAVRLAHGRAPVELAGGGRIARYAAGRDYHNWMMRRLRKLARALEREGWIENARAVVDAGPILERSHAAEAGLGFESKAANLLAPEDGPWVFLGELLLDLELEPTPGPAPGSCGTCRACIDACPTGALVDAGTLDARLCISYWTIEHRGAVPPELRERFGPWTFGCDVCSEVCPWGRDADDVSSRLGTHERVAEDALADWLRLDDATFAARFEGSPLKRPGRAGLARNAATALASTPSDAGREALLRALETDPSSVVREAAAWSLARAHPNDAGVAEALERAARAEDDAAAAALVARWAEESGASRNRDTPSG